MSTRTLLPVEADTVRIYAAAEPEFFAALRTISSTRQPVSQITGWHASELAATTDRVLARLAMAGFTASREAVFLQIARAQANHTGNIRLMDAGLLGDL